MAKAQVAAPAPAVDEAAEMRRFILEAPIAELAKDRRWFPAARRLYRQSFP